MAGADPGRAWGPMLRWPRRGSPWLVLELVFFVPATVGGASAPSVFWHHGYRGYAVVFGCGAIMMALLVIWTVSQVRVRKRWRTGVITAHTTDMGERGVCIPYSVWRYRVLLTLFGVMVVMCATSMLEALFGGRGAFAVILALLGIVVVPLFGWFLFDAARGRIVRGQVVLTLRGIYHRRAASDAFVPWESVLLVSSDRPVNRHHGPTVTLLLTPGALQHRNTSVVALGHKPDPEIMTVQAGNLAVDPALVYHALGYYLTHPETRTELATDVGVQRIRNGDLDDLATSGGATYIAPYP